MLKTSKLFALVLFFVLTGKIHAQVDPLAASVTFLQEYESNKASEKVFVHTDRPYYASGENVWFTAWVMDAVSHQGLQTSQVLYLQLLHPSGSVALERVLRVQQGRTHGDLYLPQDLETGIYTLRAYTPWMMNFDARWFFRKEIPIVNPKQKSNSKKSTPSKGTPAQPIYAISFYPEGGSLIAGIPQRVAFMLKDAPALQRAILENEQGVEMSTLIISHASMGQFRMTPEEGVSYYARLIYPDRTERIKLPEVQAFGMALSADLVDSTAFELLIRPVSLVSDVTLIGHSRGKTVFSGTAAASPEGFKSTIYRKDLPPGITQFLLFDSNGTILGQRLLFNPPARETLTLTANPKLAAKRSPITLTLMPTRSDTIPSIYAVSVVEASKAGITRHDIDLEAYVYLMSDLQRPIQEASYYLASDSTTLAHADLLMMTQSWERFDGSKIASDMVQPQQREWVTDPSGLKGKILQKRNQKPIANEVFTLMIDPENPSYYPIKTDAEGRFEIPNLVVPDSVVIVADGDNKGGRRPYTLIIDPIHIPQKEEAAYYALPTIPLDSIPSDFAVKAFNRIVTDQSYGLFNQVRTLGEVVVQAKVEPKPTAPESYNRIYGVADRTFVPTNADLSRGGNVFEFLKGKTGAFRITGSGSGTRVSFARAATLTSTTTPLFFLDGIETDVVSLARVNIQNVGAVDILTEVASTSIFGARGSNGVISVFTFKGERQIDVKPDIVSQKAPGFHQARTFYAPDYTVSSDLHKKPDTRSTLWWTPSVNLKDNGSDKLRFYSSDESAVYYIRVWGMSPNGKVIKGESLLQVK
jgi:hypothetical protein